jgi:BlaI family transcriptional regulator, penicillinase repressor
MEDLVSAIENISPARKKNQIPTPSELRLLQVLWSLGEGTVDQIVQAHPEKSRPNYKTTHTFLRIMEQKGFISHTVNGRTFTFRPLVTRESIDSLSVRALLHQNFGGSPAGLLINLLEVVPARERELDELESLIRDYRQKTATMSSAS